MAAGITSSSSSANAASPHHLLRPPPPHTLDDDNTFIDHIPDPNHHHQQQQQQPPASTSDAAAALTTTATSRRPRGRPPGSKNKPKPPIVVTRDTPNSLRSHLLEVPAGADVLLSLSDYARRRGRGLSVLSASGSLSNVNIKQPNSAVSTLRGRFDIISITGTVLPPPAPPSSGGLSVFLAGGQGQVVGGSVVGPLLAADTVVVMSASFAHAVYERMPLQDEEETGEAEVGSGSAQQRPQQQQQPQPVASQSSEVTGSYHHMQGDAFGWGVGGGGVRPPF